MLYYPYNQNINEIVTILKKYPDYLYSTVEDYLENSQPLIVLKEEDIFLFEKKKERVYVGHFFCKSRGGKALENATSALQEIMGTASLVIGFTPVANRAARWFSRKLGFKSNGLIDTAFGEAEFFSMTKKEWNEKHG